MCPETTGKSLEEIDLLFAKENVRNTILAQRIRHDELSEWVEKGKSGALTLEEV
jgi:hypothetical protein